MYPCLGRVVDIECSLKTFMRLEKTVDLHIIGGDLFDRVPSMDELTLYFDFIKDIKVPTIIYDGNHEATKKNKTFFSNLKASHD